MARRFQRTVGQTVVVKGNHNQSAFGILAKEWRSLQRERCCYGILRYRADPEWRPGAAGDRDRRRSAIPPAALHHEFTIQEGGRRIEMGSNSVHREMRRYATMLASALLCLTVCGSVSAQVELTGSWTPRNHEFLTGDGLPVDFTGIPLSEEGRIRALSYSESQLEMVEHQCQGWPAFYLVQGPFGLRIWSETDPLKGNVISYTIGGWEDRAPMTIWMDGRPHPSKYAEHTRAGFTTAKWENNTLVAYTKIGRAHV